MFDRDVSGQALSTCRSLHLLPILPVLTQLIRTSTLKAQQSNILQRLIELNYPPMTLMLLCSTMPYLNNAAGIDPEITRAKGTCWTLAYKIKISIINTYIHRF